MRALVLLTLGVAAGWLCVNVRAAFAQGTAQAQPPLSSISQPPAGDRGGDAGAFSPFRLTAPLRLSLQGSIIPLAHAFPNCVSHEDDVGNSVGGVPVQHDVYWRLTPRLVLSGFTQLGCPIDGGIGGSLTYAVPIRPSMQLAFGAGAYAAPAQFQLFGGLQNAFLLGLQGHSSIHEAARVDLVWNGAGGRAYNLGVESLGIGKQTIKFGGAF